MIDTITRSLGKAYDTWLAGFTNRWHSGPSAPCLARSGDLVHGHHARCANLALSLWPDASFDLIKACLWHDLGESVSGDIAQPAKVSNPTYAKLSRMIEDAALNDMGLTMPELSELDARRLKLVDRMDALLWASTYSPGLMSRDDWQRDAAEIEAMRAELCAKPRLVRWAAWNDGELFASGEWRPESEAAEIIVMVDAQAGSLFHSYVVEYSR